MAVEGNESAKKLFIFMFDELDVVEEDNQITYRDMPIPRVWLQGTIIEHGKGVFALDDSTGVMWLCTTCYKGTVELKHGLYASIIGKILTHGDLGVMIAVHQIMNLSDDPNREILWTLEVVDMATRFYPLGFK
eukprot:Phypoly_transcript_12387.p1 GENE.Phypoly_transcript_12387~~Phypoly_transcript_12387.p1  ORF type:complete len:133 (+),score=19.13 Phypoly_transcript_12387:503-901(+)